MQAEPEGNNMTTKAVSHTGFEWTICVRAASVEALFEAARDVQGRIEKYGWTTPEEYRKTHENLRPQPSGQGQKSPHPNPLLSQASVLTFAVETLSPTTSKGKTYWKALGGKFSQYGVSVWPEVLEAAGFSDLDPMREYGIPGWTAEYILKDNKPDKVTRLFKTA